MNPLPLSQLAEMSGAIQLAGDPAATALRISTDTRSLLPGDLYVALKGERYDGNCYLVEAASKGAVGALCDVEVPVALPKEFGVLSISDSLSGLTLMASAWRSQLTLKSVVITGSSGKTSTKDFTAAVLRKKLRVTATVGNLNNHIGLPLSVLAAVRDDEAAVWEIGMNHPGEISPLAGLAQPQIAIITGIGTAHIEHLGSREEIAREKGDLLEKLPASGVGIIPFEDDFRSELRSRTAARILEVGIEVGDLRAGNLVSEGNGSRFDISGEFGRCEAYLPVPGKHMVRNALLAVATGLLCDVSLDDCALALGEIKPSQGRLSRQMRRNVCLLDDTYNANPDSMVAALETLRSLPYSGRKIAVLGRMGELGEHAAEGYTRVGRSAVSMCDILVCIGEEASSMAKSAVEKGFSDVHIVSDNKDAARLVSSLAVSGDVILFKGSRSARLEEVIQHFS